MSASLCLYEAYISRGMACTDPANAKHFQVLSITFECSRCTRMRIALFLSLDIQQQKLALIMSEENKTSRKADMNGSETHQLRIHTHKHSDLLILCDFMLFAFSVILDELLWFLLSVCFPLPACAFVHMFMIQEVAGRIGCWMDIASFVSA